MPGRKTPLRITALSVALLLALTAAVYTRPSVLLHDQALTGLDYFSLHLERIAFAQNALLGPGHYLPGWYPRQMLGMPFSANLQSFPWIPTRLLLLLVPAARLHFALGVLIAALLSALFTYLFCRRAGLSEIASVAAGWTFASAGFFASRVYAGHLPLLEAYPSLPMLLWLADRATSVDRAACRTRDLIALAFAAACFALAGHPQIPAYSLAATALFLVFRTRGAALWRALAALGLGVAATLAVWWPMLLLVLRSTRVLHLNPPDNDVTLPYRRLLALLRPGIDGWAPSLNLAGKPEFHGHPNSAWFWDTTSYMGLLPVAVIAWLLVRTVVKRRLPAGRWGFLALLGLSGLFFALPAGEFLRELVPVTLFRSPSRLLYLSTFSASVALGFSVDAFRRIEGVPAVAGRAVVAAALLFHAIDLGGFTRLFIQTMPWTEVVGAPPFAATMARELRNERIAVNQFRPWLLERYDDAGGFDSLLLAGPYRALMSLAEDDPRRNVENLNATDYPTRALQAAGVRFVVTDNPMTDLQLVASDGDALLYRVPNPAPRVAFYPAEAVEFGERAELLEVFASRWKPGKLLLPREARSGVPPVRLAGLGGSTAVTCHRVSSDEVRLETSAERSGFVHLLEAWDPGWRAEVDGISAPVFPANGFTIAVPLAPGRHTVRLAYRTPGRAAGWAMSLLSIALLIPVVRRRSELPRSELAGEILGRAQ